jgi:hypothetical protein
MLPEGLIKNGIEVTLFATGNSLASVKLRAVCQQGYEENPTIDAKVWKYLHISECFEGAGVVHC